MKRYTTLAEATSENPAVVCRFLLESTMPDTDGDSCDATLEYIDGLAGGGQPIDNKVTLPGESVIPQTAEMTVTMGATDSRQLPGDCNQDGAFDLSDPVCLNGYLFNSSPPVLPCGPLTTSPGNLEQYEGNGGGGIDISDVVYQLMFLFRGSPPHAQGMDCILSVDCFNNDAGCS
jgi:hypothetical protein